MSYGNQKTIRIVKSECNKDNPYGVLNLAAVRQAMKLPPNAFKLWIYFALSQNGYEFDLSSKDVQAKTGMTWCTYSKALNELIERKYLVEVILYDDKVGYLFIDKGHGGE